LIKLNKGLRTTGITNPSYILRKNEVHKGMSFQFSRLMSTIPDPVPTSSVEFPLQNFMVDHATMPVVDIMEATLLDKLMEYSTISPYPVSIEELLENGDKENYSEEQSFMFLRKQVAVRLAHMIMELQHLPKELHAEEKCRATMERYCVSFSEVLQFETKDPSPEVLKDFMETLFRFKDRHRITAHNMAEACVSMKQKLNISMDDVHNPTFISIKMFLDRLYTSKIGIHMITDQHLVVYGYERIGPNNVGIIKPNCDLTSILVDAMDEATFDIENIYMVAPKVDIKVFKNDKKLEDCIKDPNTTVCSKDADGAESLKGPQGHLVPSHLFLILKEILKNSMRATVEYHWDNREDLPPISALICQADDDFTIKISDQGGGMDRESAAKCFFYQYSTIPSIPNNNLLGYGLPLARLYARYFNGDLRVASYQGYGTDVYIYTRALASSARERLPIYNRESDGWSWFDNDWSSGEGTAMMRHDDEIVASPATAQNWKRSVVERK